MLKLSFILLVVAGIALAIPEDDCVRRLDDAQPAKSQKPFRWAQFAKHWRASVELLLFTSNAQSDGRKALLPSYQVALKTGDARIKMLQELGFDFSEINDGYIGVPQLATVVGKFREKREAAVKANKLAGTSALDAGVLVRNRLGERFALPFGEDRDEVYLVDVSGRPSDFTFLIRLRFANQAAAQAWFIRTIFFRGGNETVPTRESLAHADLQLASLLVPLQRGNVTISPHWHEA